WLLFCFCFQAEDGIRDRNVTGVQTCALPIWSWGVVCSARSSSGSALGIWAVWASEGGGVLLVIRAAVAVPPTTRAEVVAKVRIMVRFLRERAAAWRGPTAGVGSGWCCGLWKWCVSTVDIPSNG